jgi:hypothetical protein
MLMMLLRPKKLATQFVWMAIEATQILIRAYRRLNLRLVDVEICVHMLHVIMLFQRFHQSQHLRCLLAG